MSKGHVLDKLSAYIDGEAKAPERIARHLQACETCAQRHMQLLKLSAHLRGMAAPEVRPEFLTRVMAHTADTAPSRPDWVFGGPQLALAALLVLGVGLALVMWMPDAQPSEAARLVAECAKWNDNDTLVAEFENRLDQGDDLSLFETPETPDTAEAEENPFVDVPLEEMIELLAFASLKEYESDDLYAQEDVFELLENLDREKADDLQNLLAEYME